MHGIMNGEVRFHLLLTLFGHTLLHDVITLSCLDFSPVVILLLCLVFSAGVDICTSTFISFYASLLLPHNFPLMQSTFPTI